MNSSFCARPARALFVGLTLRFFRDVQRRESLPLPQQRTIFVELMPLVALRVSTTSCDSSTMAL
jgi:hypothetical protein